MKYLLLTLLFACNPNGPTAVQPRPVATNSGAFSDPAPAGINSWIELGGAQAVNTSQTHQVTTLEPFAQLMVKAVDGELEIEQIQIEYANHENRIVQMKRKFVKGEGQVIELREKRPIAKIIVFTDPDSTGSYIVYGA
jgi:hypothetical protein